MMWENYGPYLAEAPEPHMAHTIAHIFFFARGGGGSTIFSDLAWGANLDKAPGQVCIVYRDEAEDIG